MLQQTFPNWDSLRIMNSRHDHLDWMHRHFADTVVNGSSVLAEIDAEVGERRRESTDQRLSTTRI